MNTTQKLLKLYRVDEQLRALNHRLESAEHYFRTQNRKVEELEAKKRQVHDQMVHASATATNFENEARSIEERMNTLRDRMSNAKTNKEYSAFLTELNTIKIDKESAETKALEHMSRAEELQAELESLETQITERNKVREVARKDLEERRAAVSDRLSELEEERKQAVKDIPENVLSEYETQLDQHDGEAMAPVLENDRRNMEYACGSCCMTIPIERLSSLLGRGEITTCPTCHRILFVEAELRESFDKRLAKH